MMFTEIPSIAAPGIEAPDIQAPGRARRRVLAIYTGLIAANLASWIWALVAFHQHPMLLGTAVLAYGFGLRHAVDADHIAAIDNVTRTLIHDGARPMTVGLFFSLGHSTVVVLASVGIALSAGAFSDRLAAFHDIGGMIGTAISAGFLLVIASINLVILSTIIRTMRRVHAGTVAVGETLDQQLAGHGLLSRLLRPLLRLIGRSWHMYPLGLLFGLGFDTATEIGLLGISATQAAHGRPVWSILVFPALFTAGMSLVDTTDGMLMTGAYGWAFRDPMRKLRYNCTITAISVLVALLVGGIEALGLMAGRLDLRGGVWRGVAALNESFGLVGYAVIALFLCAWGLSAMIWYPRRASSRRDV